jgi:hypothetical protein
MTTQSLDGTVAARQRSEPVTKVSQRVAEQSGRHVVEHHGRQEGRDGAVTGIVLVGFVTAHMLGNLKIFLGAEAIDAHAAFLRTMGEPLFPYGALCLTGSSVAPACGAGG